MGVGWVSRPQWIATGRRGMPEAEKTQASVEFLIAEFNALQNHVARLEEAKSNRVNFWMSRCVSAPTFSFGRVSMLHHLLEFYWCDISIYPGNSGGPVIEDGKLVGIVSGQPFIESEIVDEANGTKLPLTAHTRIPVGKIIKGKYLKELLDTQISKDCASSGDLGDT
jgi:hypothetical protein